MADQRLAVLPVDQQIVMGEFTLPEELSSV